MDYKLTEINNSKRDILRFLDESNKIELVYDQDSLDRAYEAWTYIMGKKRIDAEAILKTHEILMRDHLPKEHRGHWRKQPVWVGGREGKPWYTVPSLIHSWCQAANELIDPISDHIRYEHIHPFIDGNGRTGRIFLNWQRIRSGDRPIIIPSETKFEDYYPWFDEEEVVIAKDYISNV